MRTNQHRARACLPQVWDRTTANRAGDRLANFGQIFDQAAIAAGCMDPAPRRARRERLPSYQRDQCIDEPLPSAVDNRAAACFT